MILILSSVYDKTGHHIVQSLQTSCINELKLHGAEWKLVEVPGAVEIPVAAQHFIRTLKPQAVIALGMVLKGDTDHYEMVVESCREGLTRVALDEGVPIIQGVLACKMVKHAVKREDMGREYAQTALKMIPLLS